LPKNRPTFPVPRKDEKGTKKYNLFRRNLLQDNIVQRIPFPAIFYVFLYEKIKNEDKKKARINAK
jgi:hypothetical protein